MQEALPYLKQSRHASVINVLSAAVYLRSEFRGLYAIGPFVAEHEDPFGVATSTEETEGASELMHDASTAMHAAKALGRSSHQVYSPLA